MQSQEWEVMFFVPQATNSSETRTMATTMRSLSVGVAKSVREWFLALFGQLRSPPPIDRQKRPETISFEVRRIGIDQKRSLYESQR